MAEQLAIAPPPQFALIQQGAEARIFRGSYLGRPTIIKERFSKKYRQPLLDSRLRQQRTIAEVRCNRVCRAHGIDAPAVFLVDPQSCMIYMELVHGVTVRSFLAQLDLLDTAKDLPAALQLAEVIGSVIARLHDAGLVHGDLTTSNLMLRHSKPSMPVVIDFGLSFQSQDVEDQAVDLYVLERAFLSTHANSDEVFQRILDTYGKLRVNDRGVLRHLDAVRQRGRKRTAIG